MDDAVPDPPSGEEAPDPKGEPDAEPRPPIGAGGRPAAPKAASDGVRIGINPGFIDGEAGTAFRASLKSQGAKWIPSEKVWVIDDPTGETTPEVIREAVEQGQQSGAVPLDQQAVADRIAEAVAEPQPGLFADVIDVHLLETLDVGTVVESQFDVALKRVLKAEGAQWNDHQRAWRIHRSLQGVLEILEAKAGLPADSVTAYDGKVSLVDLSGSIATSASAMDLGPVKAPEEKRKPGEAEEAADDEEAGDDTQLGVAVAETQAYAYMPVDEAALVDAAKRYTLMDFQVDGVRHLISRNSALLADDMGLGKTRQSLVATALVANHTLVIAQASLKRNWRAEAEKIGMTARILDDDWRPGDPLPPLLITNYEKLEPLIGIRDQFDAVLIDEAHMLKEYTAKRTKNALMLAEAIPRRYLLTATPIMNRIREIHTLLRLGGHPLGNMAVGDFRRAYDGEGRAALNRELGDWMLRRYKEEVLDLPGKHEEEPLIDPHPEIFKDYEAIRQDPDVEALAKVKQMRVELERMKTAYARDVLASLEDGAKILIFASYVDTVTTLESELTEQGVGCVRIIGNDDDKKRQKAVDQFQDPDSGITVFLGTIEAAGMGLTLTAADRVLFVTRPWSPVFKHQAEDRAYRIGQDKPITILNPRIPETMDDAIKELLQEKQDTIEDVVEGRVTANGRAEELKDRLGDYLNGSD